MASTSTTRTKCFSTTMMAFPFIIIFLLLSYSCVCISEEERITKSYDAARTRRQLTDRHGNFLGRKSTTPIERSASLGRNMPINVDHHIPNYGDRINGERTERQLGNRKIWLDRYKEMLNRWEKNENQDVTNLNQEDSYDKNPSTPTVRETYVIPDSNSVSFLISGGDKYSSNRASLAQTLSDHKVIEGIQRLMTSTTQSTTRKLYRSTYLSPSRTRYTTQTYQRTNAPITTTQTTQPTTTTRRTTSKVTLRPQLYSQGKNMLEI